MKKNNFLLAAFIMLSICLAAQTLPEGMVKLTPENVEVSIVDTRAIDKVKNLVVAGSKESGYKAFFAAKDADHGEELWVTDGTVEGTKLVKDIFPGVSSSDISWMQRFNDKVVFQAQSDVMTGVELWISDGTETGTFMIKDIHEYGSSNPSGFTQVNETQFIFAAKDFDSETYSPSGEQRWLWVSDGTEAGTELIYECNVKFPGTVSASDGEQFFCRVGRNVYFKADTKDNEVGEELWITDGTTTGTRLLKDINKEIITTGTAGSTLEWLTNFYNEKLFFRAYSDEVGVEPMMSDGTTEGTVCIYDSRPTFGTNGKPLGGSPFMPRVYNGKMYFRGYNEEYGTELNVTDMTVGSYSLVADFNKNPTTTGTANGSVDLFCKFDGVLFGKAQSGQDETVTDPPNLGTELIYTDGTQAGSKMQSDLNPGKGSSVAWEATVVSGSMYFKANDHTPASGNAWNLFRINHKDEFPVKVADLIEGNDLVHSLRNLGGDLIFSSSSIPALFGYHYRKPNYNAEVDVEDLEINFDTRAETALKQLSKEPNKLNIYPNPAADYFCLQSVIHETVNVTVTDLTGKVLISKKEANNDKIDVSSLARGIYIVLFSDLKGNNTGAGKLILE